MVVLAERRDLALHGVDAGAGRVIVLQEDLAVLPVAVVAAAFGLSALSPGAKAHERRLAELTKRQLSVLREMGTGATNEVIAWHCRVSSATVKREVYRLYQHFSVANRAELMTRATQEGYA